MEASRAIRPLYQAVDEYSLILEWIEDHGDEIEAAGGELPPELEKLMDEIEGDIKEKVSRMALVRQNIIRLAEGAKAEADRLAARHASYQRQKDALDKYMMQSLDVIGGTKIETATATVRWQRNSAPSIRAADEDNIPEAFQRVKIELDGTKAKDYLKARGLMPAAPTKEPVVVDGLVVTLGRHIRIS
jgi:hypothetical protein